jgi:FkbM family methyltransferase
MFQSLLFKKIASKFGFFFNSIKIHGIKFTDVKSSSLKDFYFNPSLEIESFKLLKGSDYETFIDIGAYFGYFSIYAKINTKIKNIIAYEASPYNFKQLKKFLKLNNTDFEIVNKAVGDKKDFVKFYKPIYQGADRFPSHGQLDNPNLDPTNLYSDKTFESLDTEMIPLQEIVNQKINGSTLIKIDIEGYEEKALRSIQDYLKDTEQVDFLIEILINDKNKESLFNFLKSVGFNAYLLTNAGLIYEERPLTLPKPYSDSSTGSLRTLWKDHFFTKKNTSEVNQLNKKIYKYNI